LEAASFCPVDRYQHFIRTFFPQENDGWRRYIFRKYWWLFSRQFGVKSHKKQSLVCNIIRNFIVGWMEEGTSNVPVKVSENKWLIQQWLGLYIVAGRAFAVQRPRGGRIYQGRFWPTFQ
jgi:hypothetical protein